MCEALQVRALMDITAALTDVAHKQRRDIPKFVDERLYLSSSTLLILQPQSRQLEKISTIIAYVSSSGAVLTLGERTLPLPVGTTVWSFGDDAGILLREEDVRSIVQPTPGQLSLELLGVEMYDKYAP